VIFFEIFVKIFGKSRQRGESSPFCRPSGLRIGDQMGAGKRSGKMARDML